MRSLPPELIMTSAEVLEWQGLAFPALFSASDKFRTYVKRKDCGCGLLKLWQTDKEKDPFFKACAIHDFWHDNFHVADVNGVTGQMVNSWFVRDVYRIVDRLSTNRWNGYYYRARASLYIKLVRAFNRWGK